MTLEQAVKWCSDREVKIDIEGGRGVCYVAIRPIYTPSVWMSQKHNISPIIAFLEAVEAAVVMSKEIDGE